jgi:hypothetical protein
MHTHLCPECQATAATDVPNSTIWHPCPNVLATRTDGIYRQGDPKLVKMVSDG